MLKMKLLTDPKLFIFIYGENFFTSEAYGTDRDKKILFNETRNACNNTDISFSNAPESDSASSFL